MSSTTVDRVKQIAKDVRTCMFVTLRGNKIQSRPMATAAVDEDGTVWFFTDKHSDKVEELRGDESVHLAYSAPDDNVYLTLSGKARTTTDRAKMEELMNPFVKSWFPEGVDSPRICLIEFTPEDGELWESSDSTVVQFYYVAKALVTGTRNDTGEHESLSFPG